MKIEPIGAYKHRYSIELPLYLSKVQAGFPSPADDHLDQSLDLNEHLIEHPAATFFCRVTGESMIGIGIYDGDIIVVDRAITPEHGDVVLAAVDGELTCKVLDKHQRRLLSSNEQFKPIPITEDMDMIVEGVVTYSVTSHRCMR